MLKATLRFCTSRLEARNSLSASSMRPSVQPVTCAEATQLAPTSPSAAQVPGVVAVLVKLKPLQTLPSTQAKRMASALAAVHGLPCAIFLRHSPPSGETSQKRPSAHCSSASQEACSKARTAHLSKPSQKRSMAQSEVLEHFWSAVCSGEQTLAMQRSPARRSQGPALQAAPAPLTATHFAGQAPALSASQRPVRHSYSKFQLPPAATVPLTTPSPAW